MSARVSVRLVPLCTLGCLVASLGWSARVEAAPQVSARLIAGGGARLGPDGREEGLFDLGLRSELLFGTPGDGAMRLGPAFEVRAADLVELDLALGIAWLVPLWRGYPIVWSLLGGWSAIGPLRGEPLLVTTLAWGYRSYDHSGTYGFAAQLYVSGRVGPAEGSGRRWEVTGGVEVDLELLLLGPAILAGRAQGPAEESR